MSSRFKKLQKLFDEQSIQTKNIDSMLSEYIKEFGDWINSYIGQSKWSLISPKTTVLKFIQTLSKFVEADKNHFLNNNVAITNICTSLITPGNDFDIRKETISLYPTMITASIKYNVPTEFWNQSFFSFAFSYSDFSKYSSSILQIGDLRDVDSSDISCFANIIIDKTLDLEYDEFIYWWEMLTATCIPCTISEKSDVQDKDKLFLAMKYAKLVTKNIKKSNTFFFVGKPGDSLTIGDFDFVTVDSLKSIVFILQCLTRMLKMQESEEAANLLREIYDNSFGVYLANSSLQKCSFDEFNGSCDRTDKDETSAFTKFCMPSNNLLLLMLKTIRRIDPLYVYTIGNIFVLIFTFYIYLFKEWENDEKNYAEKLYLVGNHYFLMVMLCSEFIKMTDGEKLDILRSIKPYATDYPLMYNAFIFTIMLYAPQIEKKGLEMICSDFLIKTEENDQLIQVVSSVLAMEHFREKNSLDYVFDSTLFVCEKLFHDENKESKFKATKYFLVPVSVSLHGEDFDEFVSAFLDALDIVIPSYAKASYSYAWDFISKHFGVEAKNDLVVEQYIPQIIDSIASSDERKETGFLVDVLTNIFSEKCVKMHDKEVFVKWHHTILNKLSLPRNSPLLINVIDACISMIDHVKDYSYSLIPYTVLAIRNLKFVDLPKKEIMNIARACTNIFSIILEVNGFDVPGATPESLKKLQSCFDFHFFVESIDFFFATILSLDGSDSFFNKIVILALMTMYIHGKYANRFKSGMSFVFLLPNLLRNSSLCIIKMLPMINEVMENLNTKNEGIVLSFARQLDGCCDPERKFLYSLFASEMMLSINNYDESMRECLDIFTNNVDENAKDYLLQRSFELFSSSLRPCSTSFETDLMNHLVSVQSNCENSAVISTETEGGKDRFAVTLVRNENKAVSAERIKGQMNIFVKASLFNKIECDPELKQVNYTQNVGGVFLFMKKNQKSIEEAINNDWRNVSKSFARFIKSVGKIGMNHTIHWSNFVHKIDCVLLPTEDVKLRPVVVQRQKICIIWNESEYEPSPNDFHKEMQLCIMIKAATNGFVVVKVLKLAKSCKNIGPFFDTHVVTRSILPSFIRWTIIMFFN